MARVSLKIWSKVLIYESRGAGESRMEKRKKTFPFVVSNSSFLTFSTSTSCIVSVTEHCREGKEKLFIFQLIIFHFLWSWKIVCDEWKIFSCHGGGEARWKQRENIFTHFSFNFLRKLWWNSQIIKQRLEEWMPWRGTASQFINRRSGIGGVEQPKVSLAHSLHDWKSHARWRHTRANPHQSFRNRK
jgi:hypothetical protein